MDVSNFIPDIARLLGIQPSTLLFLIMVVTTAANAASRRIPDTATGWLGVVRAICTVIGVRVQSRVAPGLTVSDVSKAALAVPVIAENAAANSGPEPSPDSRARNDNAQPPTRLVRLPQTADAQPGENPDADDEDQKLRQVLEQELAKPVPTSADVMRAGVVVEPASLVERGPFPSEMRVAPYIAGDALSPPVIDLRKPPVQEGN